MMPVCGKDNLINSNNMFNKNNDKPMKRIFSMCLILFALAEAGAADEGVLSGRFSIGADRQVYFSTGNLQYTQSTDTWEFATQQYEIIGTDNVIGTMSFDVYQGGTVSGTNLADKIDLFGWSGSTGVAGWGISASIEDPDYVGGFLDWGLNVGDGKTWRMLSAEEWTYLFVSRPDAGALMGVARINLNDAGTEYVNGLILLPDAWQAPENVPFKSGFSNEAWTKAYANYQTFTLAQWHELESAGAVCLPASGGRDGVNIVAVQNNGHYWSSSPHDIDTYAHRWYFGSCCGIIRNTLSRHFGCAVRLVMDAGKEPEGLQKTSAAQAYAIGRRLYVGNLPAGERYTVYHAAGSKVFEGTAARVELPTAGLYIIRFANGEVKKVRVE